MATATKPRSDEAPAEQAPKALTNYVVLVQNEDSSWTFVTTVEAISDIKAVQKVVAERQYESGTFVAIPARSFKPRTVAVEHNPRVRVS